MESIRIHGRDIAYREAGPSNTGPDLPTGEPPTLLLIHGMAGSSTTWRELTPRLEGRFRLLAPDLPGHGETSVDFDDYSLGAMATALRDFLHAKGVKRCTVVGQSLGGGVAMQFIYQYPEFCERLVLIGSGGLGRDVSWILRLLSSPGANILLAAATPPFAIGMGNKLRAVAASRGLKAPSLAEPWAAYEALAHSAQRRTFFKTLRSVVDGRGQFVSAQNRLYLCEQVPVQIIWGEKDPIIPVHHAYDTHQALPGSRLNVIEQVGHYPHVEAPDEVEKILVDFVDSTAPGTIVIGRPGS